MNPLSPTLPPELNVPRPQRYGVPAWLWMLIASAFSLGLLGACLFGAFTLFQQEYQDRTVTSTIVDQFMHAGQQNNAQAGYLLFGAPSGPPPVTLDAIQTLFQTRHRFFTGYQTVQVISFSTAGNNGAAAMEAFAAGTVHYTNHPDIGYTASFVKIKGRWQLGSLNLAQVGSLGNVPALQRFPTPTAIAVTKDQTWTAIGVMTPTTAAGYYERGVAYTTKNDYAQALAAFTQAIALNPDYATAYKGRGIAEGQIGDYDHALSDLTRALEIAPDAPTYMNRGYAYYSKGNLDEAIRDYNTSLAMDSQDALGHLNRGIAYSDHGDQAAAIVDFEAVVQIGSDPKLTQNARDWLRDLTGGTTPTVILTSAASTAVPGVTATPPIPPAAIVVSR